MSKYHISKNGKPALCRATVKNCPLGGVDVHYNSIEEAQEAADKKNKAEHSVLANNKPAIKMALNEEFNGVELYFDEKPDQSVIETLKASRWRWHRIKRCWFAKQSDDNIELAKNISKGNIGEAPKIEKKAEAEKPKIEIGGTVSEGYMGGHKFVGKNSGEWKSYGEINKICKSELKRLFPGVVFKTRGSSYSGGQSSTLHIGLKQKELLKPRAEVEEVLYKQAHHGSWLQLNDRRDIHTSEATEEQFREHARLATDRLFSKYEIDLNQYSDLDDVNINTYGSVYTEKAIEVAKYGRDLYNSFVYSDNNAQVDYFQQNLYTDFKFQNLTNSDKKESWHV